MHFLEFSIEFFGTILSDMIYNKLETFEDALFESGKTSTHKTEKTGTLDLLPCGKRNAEKVEVW